MIEVMQFAAAESPHDSPSMMLQLDHARLLKLDQGFARRVALTPSRLARVLAIKRVPAPSSPRMILISNCCTTRCRKATVRGRLRGVVRFCILHSSNYVP